MALVVQPGGEISRERTGRRVERHHHLAPYAAIVLRGGYLEAGDQGRFSACAGDVLLHDGFEAHQDHFAHGGADILNLRLASAPAFAFARIADPDALVRLAERDSGNAAACLGVRILPGREPMSDWPDLLADDLRRGRVRGLAQWADRHGLAPSSVSRGFRLAFGVSPQRYRAEHRAGRVARSLSERRGNLAALAAHAGFADQPHMNRTLKRVFGHSPTGLRRHVNCVQEGGTSGC